VIEEFESESVPGGTKAQGEVSVTTIATLFKKIKFHTHENVGSGKIHLPEISMHTTSYWCEFGDSLLDQLNLSETNLVHGLAALSNVLENVAPIWVMTDPKDLRTLPMLRAPLSQKPTIFIYEATPGGVGYSKKLFRIHEDLLGAARELITFCSCRSGCPSCVGPVLEVGEKGKEYALTILNHIS